MELLLAILGVGKAAIGAIGKVITGVLDWAVRDWRNAALLVLAAGLAWAAWSADHRASERDQALATSDKFEAAAGKAIDAAWKWKGVYDRYDAKVRKAQSAAAAADRAHAAEVAHQIDKIRERTADDYQARLDDSRAALERVRAQFAAATAPGTAAGRLGDSRAEAVPATLTARCQALGAADCDALLAALPDQLAAAEGNTAKLIALQDYVRSLLALDFSGQSGAVAP